MYTVVILLSHSVVIIIVKFTLIYYLFICSFWISLQPFIVICTHEMYLKKNEKNKSQQKPHTE